MTALNNPGLNGDVQFDTFIYASAGLNYAAVPALVQYNIYDAPDPAYVTGRIDISAFANLGSAPWPFANTNVPLNGHVCVPHGRGPFPLAIFAHGNHDPLENSTPGYLYLCQLLASHGIIAATIDVNFLNGFNFGENDARAIVHLEHVKQFRTWDGTAAHPLHARFDLNRVLIIGHSRGGEGVGHASFFNRLASIKPDIFSPVVPLDGSVGLGPYRFNLAAAAAIAPTDRQYQPISGPTVVPDRIFSFMAAAMAMSRRSRATIPTIGRTRWIWRIRPYPTGSGRPCCGFTERTTTSSTAPGHRKLRLGWRCRARSRSRLPRSALGC